MSKTNLDKQYKEMFPLVDIPNYSENDVLIEHQNVSEFKSSLVKAWFSKKFPLLWIASTAGVMTGMYFMLQFLFKGNIELQNLLFENIAIIASVVPLFMLPWCVLLCPIPNWYKKTMREEAEFNVRASLCKEQLENANDELTMQIFGYCNTYPK